MYVYVHICTYTYVNIYVYIYIEREREKERSRIERESARGSKTWASNMCCVPYFHWQGPHVACLQSCETVDQKTTTFCVCLCAEHMGRCSNHCICSLAQHESTISCQSMPSWLWRRKERERESKRARARERKRRETESVREREWKWEKGGEKEREREQIVEHSWTGHDFVSARGSVGGSTLRSWNNSKHSRMHGHLHVWPRRLEIMSR